jgi:hypothetical protein
MLPHYYPHTLSTHTKSMVVGLVGGSWASIPLGACRWSCCRWCRATACCSPPACNHRQLYRLADPTGHLQEIASKLSRSIANLTGAAADSQVTINRGHGQIEAKPAPHLLQLPKLTEQDINSSWPLTMYQAEHLYQLEDSQSMKHN